ncbi:endosomal peripheral membrane protein [Metarhizium album ARSEF 1941]|uniref:Endosomal peripheral membrane protein n=1 Tax=Metarhizium album (strain ARSEF 1941) TaxID=1081103 RepID=A0A0B2WZR0_METAS|nr:endosomal peripheral membrane protein [Metarhizium album ARSEF 1941]KHN99079.1 endosomal peripheral membrane protein [Metarhizium album ARSEF 1941]
MTTQLLANELANLVHESKRKHNDLRQAAEKSLEELKQLGSVSEQEAPELLSQRSNFVNPFIIACGTKNAKFTAIAIVCLQRLIVAKALPKSKLDQALEALMQASSAGLDVQLKILQALPSLLQNYSAELNGNLLVTALNICFILQSSRNAIVNHTSAATLQQLVVSVFDKVVSEDKNGSDAPVVGEAPSADAQLQLRAAALDAYRIFNDLCLMTENQRPEFLRFSSLPQTFGLELIESVITNHASVFTTHAEQAQILRVRVMPLIFSALKGKPSFATTVRLVRILYTLLRRHIDILPNECSDGLEILTHLLDQDSALWKRALCMEVFKSLFGDFALVRKIFSLYDNNREERGIIKTMAATFVRLSTEKPAVIGLGHQSTMPISDPSVNLSQSTDQAMLEAGMSGIISSSINSEASKTGISTQWSSVRVPCIDQLDKTDPPSIPESYVYSLILSCLSSLSDGMAKFILPLTVPSEGRTRRKASKHDSGRDSPAPSDSLKKKPGLERTASFKKNPVPVNPLRFEDHPMYSDVKICAAIVDECWPAILATFSTFLYASLDSEYYHGLVRSFQRFAHVSGLLQLATPRDAFLSTLGKSAVPPNLLTACMNYGQAKSATPSTPSDTANTILSNARGLLSVETLTPVSPATDRQRNTSFDAGAASLNTRNLLCLRALLNLGIALGPTLGSAWGIIFETLQQADFVLFASGKAPGRTPSVGRGVEQGGDSDSLMANFNNEIRSVETAASRLIESTVDFPNASFVEVVQAVCNLLEQSSPEKPESGDPTSPSPMELSHKQLGHGHRRVLSFSSTLSTSSNQEFLFALAKLGEIASVNLERLLMNNPAASGWNILMNEVIHALDSPVFGTPVRVKAAETLSRFILEAATATTSIPEDSRGPVQFRLLSSLRDALAALNQNARAASVASVATDIDVHKIILEGLKSLIEGCGESLVSGWDIAFDIIGSGFVASNAIQERKRGSEAGLLSTRSPKLTRSAFGSLQLICSDFLSTLPKSCFSILVHTLYKFCSQDDDLNIALTTVTFFWVLSDFLSAKANTLEIRADLLNGSDEFELEKKAADHTQKGSDAALWMLMLLRLATVTSDERLDLRNSAIQTLLGIFDANGGRLNAEAWSVCIKSVIFKLLYSLEEELDVAPDDDMNERDKMDWHDTAVVVLDGISGLLANHIDVLTAHSSFNQLWRELLGHFATLLDFKVLEINTATFKALSHVLSQTGDNKKPIFNKTTVEFAWDLWSRGIPTSNAVGDKADDNQGCLAAYVAALRDVYRLIQEDVTVDNVRRMLTLLRQTVEEASVGTHVSDIEHATSLQTQTLAAVQMIRTDVDGVPSAMIKEVSEFATLAYKRELGASGSRRTYVAMSKASMKFVETLISKHASDKDIYSSGAFSYALSALLKPIALKYDLPVSTKSVQPWRLATSSVLCILKATLPKLKTLEVPGDVIPEIWVAVVAVADGILSAECGKAADRSSFFDDETFDISSFHSLRALIVPSLGSENVPDEARKRYAESLFKNSIIHDFAHTEHEFPGQEDEDGLRSLYAPKPGRTVAIPPTQRKRMAYVAFDELFSLVSARDPAESTTLEATEQESTKSKQAEPGELVSALRNRIARVAAPFLILRCALTIGAYVADQPLRGQMPQPLSQRKELIWVLTKLVELESRGEAIPSSGKAEGEGRKHLLRLYPLLVRALGVGGDGAVLRLLGEALEAVGKELGMI